MTTKPMPMPIQTPTPTPQTVFNYSILIEEKGCVRISFDILPTPTPNPSIIGNNLYISSRSIMKIFSQLNDSSPNAHAHTQSQPQPQSQNLEQICINYITCAISNEDTTEFEPSYELAPEYVTLLNQSKSFHITANNLNSSLMITDFSLKKVTSLLGNTIVGMSDYFSIAIFVFSQDELHNRFKNLTKLSLRANILEKYGHSLSAYSLFNGRAAVPLMLPIAEQNPHIDVIDLDMWLDNVEAYIEDKPQRKKVKTGLGLGSEGQYQQQHGYSLSRNKIIEKPLKYYKKPKSRPKFSRNKNPLSPFISSSEVSRQNSREMGLMDAFNSNAFNSNNNDNNANNFNSNLDSVSFNEDDIQQGFLSSPNNKKFRSTPKNKHSNFNAFNNKVNADGVKAVNSYEDNTPLHEYLALYDLGLERKLIPYKYIDMTKKALSDMLIKGDNVISLYDNKSKLARLNINELIAKTNNRSIDDIWLEVKDINDNNVYVKRRTLENCIKTYSINDSMKIGDFEGKNVLIKNSKGLLLRTHTNASDDTTNNSNESNDSLHNKKKVFIVRLARIEIKDQSTYYNRPK